MIGFTHTLYSASAPKVSIIIVNWNGWADTIECLESLATMDYPNMEVIVVDNGSTNGSADRIRAQFPDVTLLCSSRNLGFAGGNNLGIRHAMAGGTTYLWLLNNDTIVRPEALRCLVDMAEAHPSYTFYGSWIAFASEPDRLWFGGGNYSWKRGFISHAAYGEQASPSNTEASVARTSWVTGCSLLVRASSLEDLGLMDEDLFLYAEELDWQLRANPKRPAGMLVEQPLVLHKVGRSTGTTDSYLGTLFMSRNYLRLAGAHAGLALPLWLYCWLLHYVLAPTAKGRWLNTRAAIHSLVLLRRPGATIVSMLTRHQRPMNEEGGSHES